MKPQLVAVVAAFSLVVGLGIGRHLGSTGFGASISTDDPAAAASVGDAVDKLRMALRTPDLSQRSRLLVQSIDDIGIDDVERMIEAIEENRIGIQEYEMKIIMFRWVQFDPAGAYAWARTDTWIPKRMSRDAALFAWGFRDPLAAMDELKKSDNYDPDSPLVSAVVSGWLRNGDVDGVTDFIMSMPASKKRAVTAGTLAAHLSKTDIEAPIAWAESIPTDAAENFKTIAHLRTMSAVAMRDPERAMSWYLEHRGQPYMDHSLVTLARRVIKGDVSQFDRPSLLGWLVSLPDLPAPLETTDRPAAVEAGFRTWISVDQKGAHEWLEAQIERPRALDPALQVMARYLSTRAKRPRPRAAIEWALQVQDKEARDALLVQVALRWRSRNPEALQAWLDSSDVSPEVRRVILEAPTSTGHRPGRSVQVPIATGEGGPVAPVESP